MALIRAEAEAEQAPAMRVPQGKPYRYDDDDDDHYKHRGHYGHHKKSKMSKVMDIFDF